MRRGGAAMSEGKPKQAKPRLIQNDDLPDVLARDCGEQLKEAAEKFDEVLSSPKLEPSGRDWVIKAQLHVEKWRAKREQNLQLGLKDTTDRLETALGDHGKKLVEANEASTEAAKSIGRYTLVPCIVTGVLALAAIAQIVVAFVHLSRLP